MDGVNQQQVKNIDWKKNKEQEENKMKLRENTINLDGLIKKLIEIIQNYLNLNMRGDILSQEKKVDLTKFWIYIEKNI